MKKTITILTAALYLTGCATIQPPRSCEGLKGEYADWCHRQNADIAAANDASQKNAVGTALLGAGAILLIGVAAAAANSRPYYAAPRHHSSTTTCSSRSGLGMSTTTCSSY